MKIAAALATLFVALVPFALDARTSHAQEEEGEKARRDLYDEAADGSAQIDAALARAKLDGKRVLVQWGAEWCGWCHWLNDAFTGDRGLARELLYEYEVVHVDIGQFDKHMDLAEKLGAGFEGAGVPYLTILAEDGSVLVNSSSVPFECADTGDGLRHAPAKLLAFLDVYEAEPRAAQALLDAALAEAKTSNRIVMLSFGAPWCGWCHRLEDWARSPEVAPVLGKAVHFAKIDVERNTDGKAVMERYRKDASGGIPWFCLVAADGSVLATSDVDGKNLGCPWTPDEKAAFDALLAEHASALTAEERTAILAQLGER